MRVVDTAHAAQCESCCRALARRSKHALMFVRRGLCGIAPSISCCATLSSMRSAVNVEPRGREMTGAPADPRWPFFFWRCSTLARMLSIACMCPQAFELCVRPALDSPTAALDRVKMTIYTKFAEWGLPCPVTGHARTDQEQAQTASH